MSHNKLVYMANQIADFFAHEPHQKAVDHILDHILKFWDPSMRKRILDQYQSGEVAEMKPLVKDAVTKLAEAQQARRA
jgi:formate dehydrogenase subunit delta